MLDTACKRAVGGLERKHSVFFLQILQRRVGKRFSRLLHFANAKESVNFENSTGEICVRPFCLCVMWRVYSRRSDRDSSVGGGPGS